MCSSDLFPSHDMRTASKLGVHPEECVMIDDLIANVEGAKLAGMQAVLYTDTEKLKSELGELVAHNA